MPKSYAVSLEELDAARLAYEANEPRDLFYRVALGLVGEAQAGRGVVVMRDALAVLLQTWNHSYYQRLRVRFDAAHFAAIDHLLTSNRQALASVSGRSIEGLSDEDEAEVRRLFREFAGTLGPVGAAKALHLLAPRFFALWDNAIAQGGYGLYARDDRAYWRLMRAVQGQVVMIGGEDALGRNPIKAIDELSFCRFTLGLDLGPITWLPQQTTRKTGADPRGPRNAGGRVWRHGEKSAAMRELFEQGETVADVARATDADYAFAYGVRKRWLEKRGEVG